MIFQPTDLPNCFLVLPEVKKDSRGTFVKTYTAPDFESKGIRAQWKESFYTSSHQNVLRGLHFQIPPSDHDKLVGCVKG
jgi:dTDP-4-dehydrorhamnose 3,5-epimerase